MAEGPIGVDDDPSRARVALLTSEAARAVAWALASAAAVVAGWATAVPDSGRVLFWPAAGVGALWIQTSSRRALPSNLALLLVSTVVVNLVVGLAPAQAVAFALGGLVLAWSVRIVLARSPYLRPEDGRGSVVDMGSTRGVIAVAHASLVAGVVSAPLGLLGGWLVTGQASAFTGFAWVVRSTTGVFVVAGLALALAATRDARRRGTAWSDLVTNEPRGNWLAELAATAIVTVVAFVLVFDGQAGVSFAFLLVAVAAYVGFRFAPVVASVYLTAAGTVAIVATIADRGPFGSITDPEMRAVVVRVFVLVQAAISLTLSWAIRERHELMRGLAAARREADERAQLLDAVTDRLEYGVAVIDEHGHVLVRNSAASRLVPWPPGPITGVDGSASLGVHRADGAPMELASLPHSVALTTGESASAAFVVRRGGDVPEGGEDGAAPGRAEADTYVSVRAEPLEVGGLLDRRLAVVSMRDDTAHRRRIRDLETFTGAVAHDLRNPLAAMTTWVDVLTQHLDDRDLHDDGTREALERITVTGDRMGRLIADLLAYATATSAPLDLEVVDLHRLVDDVAHEVAAASGRDPQVTVSGHATVVADPVLARQVLANVIGNAVKYTAEGGRPEVQVRAHRDERRSTTVVEVTDNGVGVPEEMRHAVFDDFTRVRATAQAHPGAGLGLAICARAVARHGGTIGIGPAPSGRGSTVTMTFPDPPDLP